jgi:(E)-4-hydroxy-3-methylbut-2-enyl-diphosphate synthase
MRINRRKTKIVKIGRVYIGGNHPIAIQSMVKTKTADIPRTLKQFRALEDAGCEILRVAVKDTQDARAIRRIKADTAMPIVADIHFNWRLALEAIDNGADKIRLNPGNIYKDKEIKEITSALKQARIPLRVGVNSGSLRDLNSRALSVSERLVKSALDYVKKIEKLKFHDIVISLKASTVLETILAYRKIAKLCDYPLHLGVTATGLPRQGAIKSSIAIGALLSEGIGDTIRVSLTARPEEEVRVAKGILGALGLRSFGPEIISCPTCGRCEVDLVKIVEKIDGLLSGYPVIRLSCPTGKPANRQTGKPIKVAIMGCMVNGPGEAKEADLGIAFGQNQGLFFKHGKPVRKIPYHKCTEVLFREIGRQ